MAQLIDLKSGEEVPEKIQEFIRDFTSRNCRHYASEFMAEARHDLIDMENAIQRTLNLFRTMGVPLREHFYPVYRGEDNLYKDWKISSIACSYILLNGNPSSKKVAQLQTALLRKMIKRKANSFT